MPVALSCCLLGSSRAKPKARYAISVFIRPKAKKIRLCKAQKVKPYKTQKINRKSNRIH